MNDKPKILVGLAVGLVALTFPFWYTLAAGHGDASPQLDLPAGKTQCVERKEYMRAHHMEMLDQWRQEVVREGNAEPYVSRAFGTEHMKSLTKTCIMECHANQEAFCDRCHTQAGVRPTCWDCHSGRK
jgi:hypothetical protein